MERTKNIGLFAIVAGLIVMTGMIQSWNSALLIVNMGLISAIMALGVNLQWGFAGLFNVGVMGFVALGGLATVLVSSDPVGEAWSAGGLGLIAALVLGVLVIIATGFAIKTLPAGKIRFFGATAVLVVGFFIYRAVFDPAVAAIEAINPALQGNIGGLGLPILMAWPIGGVLAAGCSLDYR
jgi:branched-chain amino acid transport system permease protein